MKKRSIIIMNREKSDLVYGPDQIDQIRQMTELLSDPISADELPEKLSLLGNVEIIFSSWGMVKTDIIFLERAPHLEAIHHAGGTVKTFATPELFDREIIVTSSWRQNAIPVAEFTFAQIILNLKATRKLETRLRNNQDWKESGKHANSLPGGFRSTVGLVSMGAIGNQVMQYLRMTDLNILVYDRPDKTSLINVAGATPVPLEELFKRSDIVSLHTPLLPQTKGMITGNLIASMKNGATLINTARGALIDQEEMIGVLEQRPDISAVLDVLDPEPPPPGSRIFDLPNVFITPHIAGSTGNECRRLGQSAVDDCLRRINGEALENQIQEEFLRSMA